MIYKENENQELSDNEQAFSVRNLDKMWGEKSRSDAGTLADYTFFYTPSVNFDSIKLYLDYKAYSSLTNNNSLVQPDFVEYRVLSLTKGGALFSEHNVDPIFNKFADSELTLWPLRFKDDWAFFPQGLINEEWSSYAFKVRHKKGTVRRGDISFKLKAKTKKVSINGDFVANVPKSLPLSPKTFHRLTDIRILTTNLIWKPDIQIDADGMNAARTNLQGYLTQTPLITINASGTITLQITGY